MLNAGCQSSESPSDQTATAVSTAPVGTQSFDVFAGGGDIQAALDHAAEVGPGSVVRVLEGTYAPQQAGQSFLQFNARHDGLTL